MSPSSTTNTVVNVTLSAVAIATMLQHMMREMNDTKGAGAESTRNQLGPWASAGRKANYLWRQPSLLFGPHITARLADKFCGINEVHLSRVPHGEMGTTCWSVLLATIHPQALSIDPEMLQGKAVGAAMLPMTGPRYLWRKW
jgi:hypothetical protein